ncbi:hypothetical protein QUC31_014381 [Theobroma cacao]|uniref:Uncharacterized protein LOC18609254 n=1 Tax=Theobroma cacao TaxID=3641 RepID=A0AB32VJQ4_THECC|nr:PREDICTED: uncharacterized protein LOC18609254 [Theobroma cacao]WRX15090.1 hypothetical protein QQP08_007577 [Theobroma cacao]
MKRQGSNLDGATTLQAGKNEGKKKSQRAVEAKEEDGKKNEGEPAVFTLKNFLGWEEWPWLRGAADEQMSWGAVWSPLWDVDFVDKAYGSLFSDVAWDDDIWNLKTVMEIPKP